MVMKAYAEGLPAERNEVGMEACESPTGSSREPTFRACSKQFLVAELPLASWPQLIEVERCPRRRHWFPKAETPNKSLNRTRYRALSLAELRIFGQSMRAVTGRLTVSAPKSAPPYAISVKPPSLHAFDWHIPG